MVQYASYAACKVRACPISLRRRLAAPHVVKCPGLVTCERGETPNYEFPMKTSLHLQLQMDSYDNIPLQDWLLKTYYMCNDVKLFQK